MTIQEKLNSILEKASLSKDQRLFWSGAIKHLKTHQLLIFLDILEKSTAEEIQDFSLNLNEKIRALENNDRNLWLKIINKEKESFTKNV